MALIGKIRQNMWLVLVLLGLGMAGFIFMDMDASPGGGGGNPVVGKIDGEKYNLKKFEGMMQARYGNSGIDAISQRDFMWRTLINETIVSRLPLPSCSSNSSKVCVPQKRNTPPRWTRDTQHTM